MNSPKTDPAFYAGDLFGDVYHAERESVPRRLAASALVRGVLTSLIVALAALFLAQQYGFPAILGGLLLGLALQFLAEDPSLAPGLDFASKHFLRVGLVLLGLQVSLIQILELGAKAFVGLIIIMGTAFAAGLIGAKLTGQSRYAGVLAGGATAICGASAALALYAIVGKDRLDQARFTLTLVGITLASALALALYPALARLAGFTDLQAGYLVGSSIHDVAQAIGAGYAVSDEAGGHATVIKLARVALLAPVVALVAVWLGRTAQDQAAPRHRWSALAMPWFIIGFLALVALSTFVAVPPVVAERGLEVSKFLLLLAVTATALRSRLSLLLEAGWRPLAPVFAATIASFAASLAVTMFMIG